LALPAPASPDASRGGARRLFLGTHIFLNEIDLDIKVDIFSQLADFDTFPLKMLG
jgi:hypothetical protein